VLQVVKTPTIIFNDPVYIFLYHKASANYWDLF